MSARVISGTQISQEIRGEIERGVAELKEKGVVPTLAVVLVGADPASEVYVKMKAQACEAVGIVSRKLNLPENVPTQELFGLIDGLNADPGVHGILVQLPLPLSLPY